ncbi:Hypothetical protein CINCED_3A010365 [Cinara cedri]|uniref:Uncharacterized protein n=1 Tax=Cinara cedri TaxID=506608 RepID=A0A5E4M5L1_9HEMI|nr:Hypothetical protein CINCED_3A010365 [Cinara cedri]
MSDCVALFNALFFHWLQPTYLALRLVKALSNRSFARLVDHWCSFAYVQQGALKTVKSRKGQTRPKMILGTRGACGMTSLPPFGVLSFAMCADGGTGRFMYDKSTYLKIRT